MRQGPLNQRETARGGSVPGKHKREKWKIQPSCYVDLTLTTPGHWLLKLLEKGEVDLIVLARRYEWGIDTLWQDLLPYLERLPLSVRGRPQLWTVLRR